MAHMTKSSGIVSVAIKFRSNLISDCSPAAVEAAGGGGRFGDDLATTTHVKGFALRVAENYCPSYETFAYLRQNSRLIWDGDRLHNRSFTKLIAAAIAGVGFENSAPDIQLFAYRVKPDPSIKEISSEHTSLDTWNEKCYEISWRIANGDVSKCSDLVMREIKETDFENYDPHCKIEKIVDYVQLPFVPSSANPTSISLFSQCGREFFRDSGCRKVICIGGGGGIKEEYESYQAELDIKWTCVPSVRFKDGANPQVFDCNCLARLQVSATVISPDAQVVVGFPAHFNDCSRGIENCYFVDEMVKNKRPPNVSFI